MSTANHPSSATPFTPSSLPCRVTVSRVVTARYHSPDEKAEVAESQWFTPGLERPLSWDNRKDGVDTVIVDGNLELRLMSSGMQSVPQPGWSLLLTGGSSESGYTWTLYGIAPS